MTTLTSPAPPGRRAVLALARIEALRLVRHPAPWLGIAASAWMLTTTNDGWATAEYQGYLAALTPLWLGIAVAVVGAGARGLVPLAEAAPVQETSRAVARLLGGGVLVLLAAAVVLAARIALGATGGLRLGDEPGRTEHAVYTLPELLQPVLLAAFAVALGLALVRVVRSRPAAWLLLLVLWFVVGAVYWAWSSRPATFLTPVQVQPFYVGVAPATADPNGFPDAWLLAAPNDYQDYWARLVVSPGVAGAHDLYLVGLTLLLAATTVPRRAPLRRWLAAAGLLGAGVGVVLQLALAP